MAHSIGSERLKLLQIALFTVPHALASCLISSKTRATTLRFRSPSGDGHHDLTSLFGISKSQTASAAIDSLGLGGRPSTAAPTLVDPDHWRTSSIHFSHLVFRQLLEEIWLP